MSGIDVTDFVGGFFHARGFVLLLCCYTAVFYGLGDASCTYVSLYFNTVKFQLRPNIASASISLRMKLHERITSNVELLV